MLDMISVFLNLLRFDLWPKIWSVLENVPCPHEKKVYSSAFGWSVLKVSLRSISSNVSFKTCVSLSIFCFDDLSTGVSGVLKSPAFSFCLYVCSCLSYVLWCSCVVLVLCTAVLLCCAYVLRCACVSCLSYVLRCACVVLVLCTAVRLCRACLMYCGAPVLGAEVFTGVMSSSWFDPLIIM